MFTFRAVRSIVKTVPRCTSRLISSQIPRSSLSSFYSNSALHVNKSRTVLPTFTSNVLTQRRYGDHADEQSLEEQTMDVLRLFDKVDPTKVSVEAHLINDLGLDSLDVVEVVMAFEDEFGIEISDTEAEAIFTIQQAVDLIRMKLDL